MTEHEEDAEEVRQKRPENQENVEYEKRLNLDPFWEEWGRWAFRKRSVSNVKLLAGGLIGLITYPVSAYAIIFYAVYQYVAAYNRCDKDELFKKVRVEEVE